jgi:hypothetical protein
VPKQRVVFWFDRDSEVRYLRGLPEVGDHVTHGRELWLVARTGSDAFERYVICERSSPVSEERPERGAA